MSTVVIVHGWSGDSESAWIPWIQQELKQRGMNVIVPDMPETNNPKLEAWVPALNNLAKDADENFYFIGHSIGCLTIIKYLEGLPEGRKVGGAIFVAGWTILTDLSTQELIVAKPWMDARVDWNKVRTSANAFVDIYSNDDPEVPEGNAHIFHDKLNAKLVLDENRGHFDDDDDVTQLPSLLREILEMMGMHDEQSML